MSKALQLPAGWKEKRLKDVGKCLAGLTYTPKDVTDDSGLLVLRSSNVQSGKLVFSDNVFVKKDVSVKNYAQSGDILVCVRNGSRDLIGKNAIVTNDGEGLAHGAFMMLFRSKQNQYLYQLFSSDMYNKQVYRNLGATINSINSSDFYKFRFPFPPLPEQKAIADLLSTWDKAIEKTERLIQVKKRRLKGQIQKIMGKEAIEANGWSMVHLGDLFSEVTRKVGEKELTPYSISAGIGFVSQREKWGKDISGSQHKNYTHLKAGEFSYNKGNSKRYQQGCIYLLKYGEICVPNVFISFKPQANNVVPEFFEHYFIADYHARELKQYITSGARSDGLLNLNKKDFFKIMIPCPTIGEQKAIAEALTTLQQEINLLKQLVDKYKTQKRGLMQKMLTGEWRIKPDLVKLFEEQ